MGTPDLMQPFCPGRLRQAVKVPLTGGVFTTSLRVENPAAPPTRPAETSTKPADNLTLYVVPVKRICGALFSTNVSWWYPNGTSTAFVLSGGSKVQLNAEIQFSVIPGSMIDFSAGILD
jgi:hypothetical protein